jgi:hypothetical protein
MIQHLFFKYHSVRKQVLSTQTIKKKNKRGHVVLTTPFTFCLLKNFGSHAKNSAFSNFLRKRWGQPHTHFSKWGICPLVDPLALTPTLPFSILLNNNV